MLPGFVLGAICSGFISELIEASFLQQIFAVFVILMAIQMAFPFRPSANNSMPSNMSLFLAAVVIAIIAGLMGLAVVYCLYRFLLGVDYRCVMRLVSHQRQVC